MQARRDWTRNSVYFDGRQIGARHVIGVARPGEQGREFLGLLIGPIGGPPNHHAAVRQRQRDGRDGRRGDAADLPGHLRAKRGQHLQRGLGGRIARAGVVDVEVGDPGRGRRSRESTPSRSNRCGRPVVLDRHGTRSTTVTRSDDGYSRCTAHRSHPADRRDPVWRPCRCRPAAAASRRAPPPPRRRRRGYRPEAATTRSARPT